ncbi:two component transcriptional regulator, LytTR family [Algoriphagus faecimaris]|uniref:Two component transcriptional regulator, LytTR family n=1 Tax=Algoriphagus faecimaris TaxID=686796 RepID=A0A1G6UU63_9BACT|nr:LytTR family DNA-binding domain-containing protein [Algoriphagus faecimaris]SDD44852.1 two component transcriptional regulator, LytTR family [Algoriphagus faecimaris]
MKPKFLKKLYRVGLIDDEEHPLKVLSNLIGMTERYKVSFTATEPMIGLEKILRGEADILITDIRMDQIGGLEISRKLMETGIPVIFCSGYREYAIDAFRVKAMDFIEKPPIYSLVCEALDKAAEKFDDYSITKGYCLNEVIFLKTKLGPQKKALKPLQILYIEQKAKVSQIVMEDGEIIEHPSSFKELLGQLPFPYIMRVHHSYAINLRKIKIVNPKECQLVSGEIVPISRSYKMNLDTFIESNLLNLGRTLTSDQSDQNS